MKKIAFFTRKGGTGKSTHAFNLACFAALTCKVLLISTDPQGDSIRWAGGGDRQLICDDPFKSKHGFTAIFAPGQTISDDFIREHKCNLAIIDLPPSVESILDVSPDLWVIPIDGRNALLDTMPAIPDLTARGGQILWLPNALDIAGSVSARTVFEALKKVPQGTVLPAIPTSAALARVAECYLPVWDTPFGKTAIATKLSRNAYATILKNLPQSLSRRSA